jgi:RNA polymerase sigma-70 factor (ECF subfamily)
METVQSYPPHSDAEEAEAIATTDFVACYQNHYRRLTRALRLSGVDEATAEDIAQEAFARALVRWRRICKGANPPGYVYTTAFRLVQRAQRRAGPPPIASAPSTASAPPTASARTGPSAPTEFVALTAVAVEAALASMPPRRRICAVMCLIVGMPVSDAASALGIAAGTVRKHLDEARRDFRAECEPPG